MNRMKPMNEPAVCIVVSTKQNRRKLSATQRGFYQRVETTMQAGETKAPAPGGNQARAVSKPSTVMTMTF